MLKYMSGRTGLWTPLAQGKRNDIILYVQFLNHLLEEDCHWFKRMRFVTGFLRLHSNLFFEGKFAQIFCLMWYMSKLCFLKVSYRILVTQGCVACFAVPGMVVGCCVMIFYYLEDVVYHWWNNILIHFAAKVKRGGTFQVEALLVKKFDKLPPCGADYWIENYLCLH